MLHGAVCDKQKSPNRHQHDSANDQESENIRVIIAGPRKFQNKIRDVLPKGLHDVKCVDRHAHLLAIFKPNGCDLLVIDTSLNSQYGLADVKSFSFESESSYILNYTADCDEPDMVLALESGADDCLTSSCSTREIEARVRAMLRRCANEKARLKKIQLDNNLSADDVSQISGWSINRDTFTLISPDGKEIRLTRAEYLIISELVKKPILVKAQNELLKSTDVNDEPFNDRKIDNNVSRFRKKLAKFGGGNLIETVRGQGYRLSVPVRDLK